LRLQSIAVFMLLFNLSLTLVNNLAILPVTVGVPEIGGQNANSFFNSQATGINSTIGGVYQTTSNAGNPLNAFGLAFQLVLNMIPMMITLFVGTFVSFPVTIQVILSGIVGSAAASYISVPLGGGILLIEIFGLYQLISGRSLREAS
jgi:hypothetical protein